MILDHLSSIVLAILGLTGVISGLSLLKKQKQNDADIATIMYSITHDELSNPVQSALATVDNLQNSISQQSTHLHKDVTSLRNSLMRLTEVTRNLRALAFLEIPNASRTTERVNLVGVLQRLIVELGEKADRKNVRLIYEGGDSAIYVLAKKEDLERLFSNLIHNGIKYRSRDAKEAFVVLSIAQQTRKVQIVVSDNGVGISAIRLTSLGQAPQRPDANNIGTRGAGLGLYLTSKIVNSYQGTISVESTEKRGTSVTVTLPLHTG